MRRRWLNKQPGTSLRYRDVNDSYTHYYYGTFKSLKFKFLKLHFLNSVLSSDWLGVDGG